MRVEGSGEVPIWLCFPVWVWNGVPSCYSVDCMLLIRGARMCDQGQTIWEWSVLVINHRLGIFLTACLLSK